MVSGAKTLLRARGSRLRVVAYVSGVVKKSVIVPAVRTVARLRSSVSDYALHPVEHRLSVLSQIAVAAQSFLDPETSYGSQKRRK